MEHFVPIMSFLGYTGLVALYSWYKCKHDNMQSAEGYFLGGRSLTGIFIAGSLILTNLSTEQLVGLNGQSYKTSMVVMAWEVTAPVALICFAMIFLPKYLKSGIATIPKFLEQRYDSRVRQIITVLFLLGYGLVFLPTVLYSGALVLDGLFSIHEWIGVSQMASVAMIAALIGCIGISYVVSGGLKAVAVSDTINSVGLLVGGLLIPILGLFALADGSLVEGVKTLVTNHPEKLNSIGDNNSPVPWPTLFLGLFFNNLFYFCTNQAIVQRAFGAINLAEAQKGALYAGFFKIIDAFFLVIPGIIAYHLYGTSLSNADMAYPTLVMDVLPKPLTGLFAAILFGAIMSAFNGALSSSVTLFSLDIYKPMINQAATEEQTVKVGRRFAIALAGIAILVAPLIYFAPSGLYYYLQESFGFYNIPIIAAVVVGIYSKWVPALAVKIALLSHIVLYGASKVFLGDIHFLYILSALFPINILVLLLVGKYKPRAEAFIEHHTDEVDVTPWKHVKLASCLLIGCMLLIYAIFSKIGLAA